MAVNSEFLREIRAEARWGMIVLEDALSAFPEGEKLEVSGAMLERGKAEKLLISLSEAVQKRKVCTMQQVLDQGTIPFELCLKGKEWGKLAEMIKRLHGDLFISSR